MNIGKSLILTILLVFTGTLQAQQMQGIYQVDLLDKNGNAISRASAFVVQDKVLTSFHFLNSRLLEADRINLIDENNNYHNLDILSYSELNDILILQAPVVLNNTFKMAKQCPAPYYVAGFYKNKLLAIKTDSVEKTELQGVYRLPVYLKKGLSGAALLNSDAEICGMVVLSSEQNASSIAVSESLLKQELHKAQKQNYFLTINDVKRQLGVTVEVASQDEINRLIFDDNKQYVVNINSDIESEFIINSAKNIIVTSSGKLQKLIINAADNVMLKNINIKQLIVNKSQNITVNSCNFENSKLGIYLSASNNIVISKNNFTNLSVAVVLKKDVNFEGITLADNNFTQVKNNVLNLK